MSCRSTTSRMRWRIEEFADEVERRWNRLPGDRQTRGHGESSATPQPRCAPPRRDSTLGGKRHCENRMCPRFEPFNRQLLSSRAGLAGCRRPPGSSLVSPPHLRARGSHMRQRSCRSVGGHRGRRWRPSPRPGSSSCRRASARRRIARSPQLTGTEDHPGRWPFVPRKRAADFVNSEKTTKASGLRCFAAKERRIQ